MDADPFTCIPIEDTLGAGIPAITIQRCRLGRYEDSKFTGMEWYGVIEPDDHSWIIYLDKDGKPWCFATERDPETGGVTGPIHDLQGTEQASFADKTQSRFS